MPFHHTLYSVGKKASYKSCVYSSKGCYYKDVNTKEGKSLGFHAGNKIIKTKVVFLHPSTSTYKMVKVANAGTLRQEVCKFELNVGNLRISETYLKIQYNFKKVALWKGPGFNPE